MNVIEKCAELADWNQNELQRMPDSEFRRLVVEAIADIGKQIEDATDRIREMALPNKS